MFVRGRPSTSSVRVARRRGEQGREALQAAYTKLIQTAERTGAQGKRALEALKQSGRKGAEALAARVGEFLPRSTRGIEQARRRVLEGESVPAKDKPLSLFEPHTRIIPRFKAGKPVEFGREIRLDEVEGGIITGYAILERGGGQDQPYPKDSLATHRRHSGRAPDLLAADRGMSSAENEELAQQAGVEQVALPRAGRASAERKESEKGRGSRRGYRFRAGIEGRIHMLRRDRGLKRCRYHGEHAVGRWVGWGIVTHNPVMIAEAGSARRDGQGAAGGGGPSSDGSLQPRSLMRWPPSFRAAN